MRIRKYKKKGIEKLKSFLKALLMIVGIFATIIGIISGIFSIIEFYSKEDFATIDSYSHYENQRFGFSFDRPSSWLLDSPPINGDGNTLYNPNDSLVKITAYGGYYMDELYNNDSLINRDLLSDLFEDIEFKLLKIRQFEKDTTGQHEGDGVNYLSVVKESIIYKILFDTQEYPFDKKISIVIYNGNSKEFRREEYKTVVEQCWQDKRKKECCLNVEYHIIFECPESSYPYYSKVFERVIGSYSIENKEDQ